MSPCHVHVLHELHSNTFMADQPDTLNYIKTSKTKFPLHALPHSISRSENSVRKFNLANLPDGMWGRRQAQRKKKQC